MAKRVNNIARDQKIVASRLDNRSYAEIAGEYGLSTGRVRQICGKHADYLQTGLVNEGEMAFADPFRLFQGPGARPSPYNPSSLVGRKGLNVFDKMRVDDQVKAALFLKKMAVLASGWEVISPKGRDNSWEPTLFIREQLEGLEGSLEDSLTEIMTALDYGFSVSEKVFVSLTEGDFVGKLGLQAIKSRLPHSFNFDTDPYGNLVPDGLLQDTVTGEIRLPPEKFIIYTYQKEFGNFYGKSDLEAAYRPFWLKNNTYKWLAMLLERFGIPPVFALYNPKNLTPAQIDKLVTVLGRIQAATSGALPRADKDSLEMWTPEIAGNTNRVFIPALNMFNLDIARAILMPGLLGLTTDAEEGSFARAAIHFDVFLLMVNRLRSQLTKTIMMDQVIRPLIRLNFGNIELPLFRFLPLTDALRLEILDRWISLVDKGVVEKRVDDEDVIRNMVQMPSTSDSAVIEVEKVEESPPEETLEGLTQALNFNGLTEYLEEHPHTHDHAMTRSPNEFEKKIDFKALEGRLDNLEDQAKALMIPIITDMRDTFIASVQKSFTNNIGFVKAVEELSDLASLRRTTSDWLFRAFRQGLDDVRKELSDVKTFADDPYVIPEDALRYLRADSGFFVKGLNGDLTKETRAILMKAIRDGWLLSETIKALKDLYEPWIGSINIIRDGDIIKPSRLETIVRTNTTRAYNMGRIVQMREASDFVPAMEYSAIIDSRTTPICRFLDGKIFETNSPELVRLSPPRHYNCRSVLIPVTLTQKINEADIITVAQIGRGLQLSQEGF